MSAIPTDVAALALDDARIRARAAGEARQDALFRYALAGAAAVVLVVLGAAAVSMLLGGRLAFETFGWHFIVSSDWDAVGRRFGAFVPIYGTLVTSAIAMMIAIPVSFGIALFLTEIAPAWLRGPVGAAIELLAGIPSIIYGMWGLFSFVPLMADHVLPWVNTPPGRRAVDRSAVQRAAAGHRHADGRHRARHHGHPVHLVGHARRLSHRARSA